MKLFDNCFGVIDNTDNEGMNSQLFPFTIFHYRLASSSEELRNSFPLQLSLGTELEVHHSVSQDIEDAKLLIVNQMLYKNASTAIEISCKVPASLKRSMIHQKLADDIQTTIGMVMNHDGFLLASGNSESLLKKHFDRLGRLPNDFKKCSECYNRINIKELGAPFCPKCHSFGSFFTSEEKNQFIKLQENWRKAQVNANKFMRQYTSEVLNSTIVDATTTNFFLVGFRSCFEA